MTGKKHPILSVLAILVAAVVFLGAAMAVILSIFGPSSAFSFRERIGVINVEGTIIDSEPILNQLVDFKRDKSIKAIVMRVNSPGGGVAPSQEIYREIRKTIKTKKVIASMGNLAASGGYYISSAADKIVASPGTLSGSIGVIMEFVQLEDLLKKLGVGLEVVKTGEFKDIGSPHRKMSERDRGLITALIQEIQTQFVEAVARGRNLPVEKVREIADGRILSGARCKELGLVDMLGNFQDAVDLAKQMSGIEGEVTLVYARKARGMLWELLFDDAMESAYRAARNVLQTQVEYRWNGFQN
ncbi:MAG: signal peptide peptidase SppA [Deltaproteobacteria bacterium]|nr:signal peptide peptidase SppA [Deltaproteobacteria bacterium]